MEDIRTNFDRFMAKFNDSVTHTAPKKLQFENLNDSLKLPGPGPASDRKRRRLSNSDEESDLHSNGSIANFSLNNSNAAPPASPWEMRRLKADFLESKNRISSLKHEIERIHKMHAEKEALSEKKVMELMKQCEFSSNKVIDVEKHLEVVRKREHATKQHLLKAQSELDQLKLNSEERIRKLERSKTETEENARIMQTSLSHQLSEYRRHAEKLGMELDMNAEEMEILRNQIDDWKDRAAHGDAMKSRYEREHQELLTANSRIKELEFQIASYEDWTEITKKTQTRLLTISDITKEVERLKENNKHLHGLLGNKLLLEEQVHDYKTRLEKEEGARNEVVSLQVKLKHTEQELKEWISVGQDHCPPNTIVSPMALRSRIEHLLQDDIVSTAEKNTSLSETKCKDEELLEFKQKYEIYAKNIEELNIALRRHKSFKERVQKKLLLVSKERDFYKQIYETMDKTSMDMTVATSASEASSMEVQLRARVDMLEKTLIGYKEMVANLEKEHQLDAGSNVEGYDQLKKELDKLRLDNERLQRRKESLELELEQINLRSIPFNGVNKDSKVVHLINNPAAEAYENSQNMIEKLQAQIERLKRRNQKLEEENEVTQARLNETTNLTANIKEVNQVRADLESANAKMKKMKEFFKSTNTQFREVCYLLFGYKIDCSGLSSNYKLSSMYAESEDDYLNFCLNEDNGLSMLETPYSVTLQPLMESQLMGNKSLPVFLSALTLELFQRTTVTVT